MRRAIDHDQIYVMVLDQLQRFRDAASRTSEKLVQVARWIPSAREKVDLGTIRSRKHVLPCANACPYRTHEPSVLECVIWRDAQS